MEKKFGFLSSSANPEALGNTVKALILGWAAVVLFVAHAAGIPFTDNDVIQFATQAGMAVSSIWFLYGICQKVLIGLYNTFLK